MSTPNNAGTGGTSGAARTGGDTGEPAVSQVNIANQISPRSRRRLNPVRATIIQMRRQRKNFVIRVYSLAMIFSSITLAQWLIILSNDKLHKFFKENYQITYIAVLASLVLLTIFILFDEIRYVQPYSTIFALLLVECAMFGMLQVLLRCKWDQMLICTLVTMLAMIGFIFIGVSIPRDLTQDALLLSVMGMVLYFVLWISMIVAISIDAMLPILVLTSFIILLLIVYVMYFAQLIDGSRTFSIRWSDYIFASLLVYFSFTVLFALIILAVIVARQKIRFDYDENG